MENNFFAACILGAGRSPIRYDSILIDTSGIRFPCPYGDTAGQHRKSLLNQEASSQMLLAGLVSYAN